jgi:hypothetical protein
MNCSKKLLHENDTKKKYLKIYFQILKEKRNWKIGKEWLGNGGKKWNKMGKN